jgi:hypothetical protein
LDNYLYQNRDNGFGLKEVRKFRQGGIKNEQAKLNGQIIPFFDRIVTYFDTNIHDVYTKKQSVFKASTSIRTVRKK